MRPTFYELRQIALGALLALATGCGTSFDPASEVKSLRVLGVQRSQSYPRPGESVDLKLLWHDGSGYCVFYKRLDRGGFRIPESIPAGATRITMTASTASM